MNLQMLTSLALVAIFLLVESTEAKSNYVVIVPSVVRPGRTLDISVQVFKEGVHQVSAKMLYENTRDRSVETVAENSGFVEMQDIITLEIPEQLTGSQYRVYVQITDPEDNIYSMNATVTAVLKTLSIYLITDKAKYKPGSLVQLRAMAVYSDLLPYTGNLDIIITDPNKSRIKQWLEVNESSGVVSRELQLSDQPVLGTWTIEVTTATREKKSLQFTVLEYVLPKFDVKLSLPSYMWSEDKSLTVGVKAMYTFGQPVKGQADVMIKLQTYSSYQTEMYDLPTIHRTIELEKGKAMVILTTEELVSLAGTTKCYSSMCYSDQVCVRDYALMENLLAHRTILVSAVVKETLTGKNYTTDGSVSFVRYPYVVSFMDFTPTTFKTGLLWSGMIWLKKVDNSAISAQDLLNHKGEAEPLKVTFSCTVNSYMDDKETWELYIEPSGFIPITALPHVNATYCEVNVQFKYAETTRRLSKFLSQEKNGLQVTLLDQEGPVQPDTTVLFNVITTVSTKEIYIQFISKGKIIDQRTHTENENMTEFDIAVVMDKHLCRKLAPSPRIFVWMITESEEFIVDSLDFSVDGAFTNKVSVGYSSPETEPGHDMRVTVEASPQSYVGLLAVDQSVLLLGGSNDITQQQVLSDLGGYDSGNGYSRPYYGYYYCWWPIYRGGKDTAEVIRNAGLQVMTDSLIYQYRYCYNCGRVGPLGERGQAGAPGLIRGQAGSRGEPGGAPGAPPRTDNVDLPPESPIRETDDILKEPQRIRTEFPETWLWHDLVAGPDGKVSLQAKVPDTITSWVASAFALHHQDGLGIAPNTAKLTVSKPWFVSLDLPYSMIRGEEVALKVNVFNYLTEDIRGVVTLKASTEFNVRHPSFGGKPMGGEEVMKEIFVQSGDATLVSFWIVPLVLGEVSLTVEARSTMAADALTRTILVEPEGEEQEHGVPVLISLHDGDQSQQEVISIEYPSEVVDGSQRALFTAYGDLMGPSLGGLDKLLRMPYGCGEQNMINFAPSIYILSYLKQTGTVTPEIEAKAIRVMESGYQRELSYHRKDGAFSAFGESDASGSTWLTAFVIRCFHQAKPYITIDQTIIDQAVRFIIRYTGESREFTEPGRVSNSRLQGGSSKGVSLTAYITASLLENKEDLSSDIFYSAERAIQSAIIYLEGQLEDIKTDPYVLSLVTYTLTLGKSPKAAQALQYLNDLATNNGRETYWKKEEEEREIEPYYWWRYRPANAYNVEMTSYSLLTYTEMGKVVEGSKIVFWLAKQRNSLGGFRSTQDTVIALQAMSDFQSALGVTEEQEINIHLQVDDVEHTFQTINSDNALLLQSYEVPSAIHNVTIEATGKGIALLQMNIFYHQLEGESEEGLEINVVSTSANQEVQTQVCVRWVREEESGMVVIEMGLPTAYVPVTETLLAEYGHLGLKRYEVTDRKLVLYLDEVTVSELCMSVTSVNVSPVSNLQEAMVLVYQYYTPEVRQSVGYVPVGLNNISEDFCEVCPDCCEGTVTTAALEVVHLKGLCDNNPCKNGGRCLEDFSIYRCKCPVGYRGSKCQYNEGGNALDIQDQSGSSTLANNRVLLAALSTLMMAFFML